MSRGSGRGRGTGAALLAIVAALVLPATAAAITDVGGAVPPSRTPPPTLPDPLCLQSYADDAPRGGPAVRFGIGPRLAGESGGAQSGVTIPEDPAKRDAALIRLRGTKHLALRLNRLFMADGDRGIATFKRLADHYGRLGFDVELQVRYHPRPADDGNIDRWLAYVRKVVRAFGPNRHVTALQITNEVNIAFSRNTSDGAYARAIDALTRGVVAAQRESHARGYASRLKIGFNYAYRFGAENDARFWHEIGRGGVAFRRAVDWVGLDIYPGTYNPLMTEVVDYGDAMLEGIAQVRECYMRGAGLGRSVPLRIEETGWPTPAGRTDAMQRTALQGIVSAVNAYRGTYHVTDLRWFGLRDNNTADADNAAAHFGLLRDDYAPKPAFDLYRRLIARYGAG